MKQPLTVISLVLICVHLTIADVDTPGQYMRANSYNDDGSRRVASIHRRITAVPSSRRGPSKASENNHVPTIERTISTLHSFRRVRQSVTPYPKHHLLQPIEVPLEEVHPKEDLNSTTAPYTDNHHSWKKAPVILNNQNL